MLSKFWYREKETHRQLKFTHTKGFLCMKQLIHEKHNPNQTMGISHVIKSMAIWKRKLMLGFRKSATAQMWRSAQHKQE